MRTAESAGRVLGAHGGSGRGGAEEGVEYLWVGLLTEQGTAGSPRSPFEDPLHGKHV